MKLLNMFNWLESLISFFTLSVGGGGGGSQTSTGTTYTSNIPEYAKPFYEELMKQSAKNVFQTDDKGNVTGVKPYTPYPGTRIAPLTQEQLAIKQNIAGLQTPGGFGAAQANLGSAAGMGGLAGVGGLAKALSYDGGEGYNPGGVGSYGIKVGGISSKDFSASDAKKYMSPYQQAVTDIALREAQKQADLQKQQGMMGAIGRNTFGGARQALMQSELDRNTLRSLADVQAKGSSDAYTNAQQQFNADQARRLQASVANQNAQVQAAIATQQAKLQDKVSTMQAGVSAYGITSQAKTAAAQLAGQIGLGGLNATIDAAKSQSAASAQEQTANLERLKTQASSASEVQAIDQKIKDLAYQSFMEQQNWGKAQLEFYNSMLRGTPGLATTQIQYAPSPSTASQLGGLGLGALGLSKALG